MDDCIGLWDWLDDYLRLRGPEVCESTLALDRDTVRRIKAFCDDIPLEDFGPAMADDFRLCLLSTGLAPTTVAANVSRAHAMFRRAVRRGLIERNPFDLVPRSMPQPLRREPQLSDQVAEDLIRAAPDDEWRKLIGLVAYAGLRRCEAIGITYEAVDYERNRLVVPNIKTSARTGRLERDVLMEPRLAELLCVTYVDDPTRKVCIVQVPSMHRKMHAIIRRAGYDPWPMPFHAWRKWRSSTWKQRYPEFIVDAWLGHSIGVARRHYTQIPEEVYQHAG